MCRLYKFAWRGGSLTSAKFTWRRRPAAKPWALYRAGVGLLQQAVRARAGAAAKLSGFGHVSQGRRNSFYDQHQSRLALHGRLIHLAERTYADDSAGWRLVLAELRRLGMAVLAPEEVASPAVTTIVLPPRTVIGGGWREVGRHGFLLSYQSRYLVEHNWIQICLMGEYRIDALPTCCVCWQGCSKPSGSRHDPRCPRH